MPQQQSQWMPPQPQHKVSALERELDQLVAQHSGMLPSCALAALEPHVRGIVVRGRYTSGDVAVRVTDIGLSEKDRTVEDFQVHFRRLADGKDGMYRIRDFLRRFEYVGTDI